MTHEELVSTVISSRNKVNELKAQICELQAKEEMAMNNYVKDCAKFKKGDAVHYTVEKYKNPRKYYVSDVFAYIDKDDEKCFCKIVYGIKSANGFRPNSGWYIDEKHLAKAE